MTVKLQVFEGPLDLLLHLLEKNKVNIYDIPIVEITNQYMEYIAEMKRQDLNVVSEFLVMAATLIDIKSRMLLPAPETEDEEEEEADQLQLSDENKKILEEMDKVGKNKKGKKQKKPKKEKKPKKPKKEKKPKAPKEKKERIGWEKGPKLPKGPVIVIWVFVMSIVVFVLICTFLLGNNSKVTDAQNTYNQAIADLGQNKADSIELYTKAYSRLSGLKLSGDDKQLYNKLSVLASVSGKYDAYKSFSDSGYVTMAADSLVCAAGRCAVNAENAKEYGCELQLEQLKNIISDTLSSQYGLSYDDAIALYNIDDRDDYTLALTQKLNELGIKEETK